MDEIRDLIESVSEGFPTYSFIHKFSYHFEFIEKFTRCISLVMLFLDHTYGVLQKIITLLSFQCMFK